MTTSGARVTPAERAKALPRDPLLGTPLRHVVRDAVGRALRRAIASGVLPAPDSAESLEGLIRSIEVEVPASSEHGDYASNVAMKSSKLLKRAPAQIATAIVDELRAEAKERLHGGAGSLGPIADAEVAGPGFLNMRLRAGLLADLLDAMIAAPDAWGHLTRADTGAPTRVNVEFVSANPTGPLTVGNARGAFVGDLLARVLEAAGQEVTREYYFNDFGEQVRRLGESVIALRNGQEVADDGYKGDYVASLANAIPPEVAERARSAHDAEVNDHDQDEVAVIGKWASEQIRIGIQSSLAALGVEFDVWRSEGSLYTEGHVERAIEKLRAAGWLEERDGALWFKSTAFGDDKDRVIKKSTGAYTYFGSDIGYVEEKFGRGFDHLVYVWGADHHGTVARVRNAGEALGYKKERMEMLLVAWVRFVRDGVEMSMSKRAGTFVTLDELLEEIGVDSARWYFASRSASTAIDFDIKAATARNSENPVYYAQYAHARMQSILRKASAEGMAVAAGIGDLIDDVSRPDAALARVVVRLPEVVEDAAAHHETQGITTYASELATAFSAFYRDAKVVDSSAPELSAKRLRLVQAAATSLAASLRLLGISAPAEM
ncbi:MAG: arginine--tRNA ligase [Candidatus Limnocylindrus sp.]|jgi:arginyl-tRNA synthetase